MNSIDRTTFFTGFRAEFGALRQSQVDGIEALLAAMESDELLTDYREAAYMLATVKHECADTWLPIEEYGKGKNHPYGKPATVPGSQTANIYYGRGYVQLTWLANYLKLGDALGIGAELALHPEKALEPAIAYRVMAYGMRNGTFTGRKISDYINITGADYVKARRIINGLDLAVEIGGYAQVFERVLRFALDYTPEHTTLGATALANSSLGNATIVTDSAVIASVAPVGVTI